jgi:hypothetical protein
VKILHDAIGTFMLAAIIGSALIIAGLTVLAKGLPFITGVLHALTGR